MSKSVSYPLADGEQGSTLPGQSPKATPWHALPVTEVLARLTTHVEGLSVAEAAKRLEQGGRNEITRHQPVSPWRLFLKQFANFFILMLLFASVLAYAVSYLPNESGRRLTALFILAVVLVSVILGFLEEYRAQKELEALDRLLVFKTVVSRDATRSQINASEIVPGDILVLSQGQKVPADARVIQAFSMRTDESALTGESIGVDKSPAAVAPDASLAERTSMVFGSTYVTHGTGLAVAVATGMNTEVGQVAATLQQMSERPTPFQVEVQKMARQMTVIIGILAVAIAVVLLFLLHEPPIDVVLNTLSLAVATIPESLPIVLTFALALGARQMAARHAVVRRLSVVESLGSVDTICTDKTGTLTQNSMTLQRVFTGGQVIPVAQVHASDSETAEVLRAGILCNEAIVAEGADHKIVGDPVDTAMIRSAQSAGLDIERERASHPRTHIIPFSSERKMMTTVHAHDGQWVAYAKGAPGAILSRCMTMTEGGQRVPLDDARRRAVRQAIDQLQAAGMYVLGLAKREFPAAAPTDGAEQEMTFLGLQALIDPPKPGAAETIEQAKGAGIRVIMITGDNALTAKAVAKDLGIGQNVVEARELERLSRQELVKRMEDVDIVSRATPQIKQQVLQALQDEDHFVAMTGDGVNDATALKQSDVGMAMGLRGTDIAKESAAMVLLDDNISSIVAAIEEGRRIFDNIRKFTNYLLSTSLGEVVVVLALSLAGFFPLSAKMLLWINVVTDLIPASALAADPAVSQVMKRRPRRHDEPILNKSIYATIAGSIFRTLIAYSIIFWAGLQLGGVTYARTMLFTSIVLHAFTRVMVVRQLDDLSIWSNRTLLWSYAAAVSLQLLALYTPLNEVFGIIPLDWRAWVVMVPVVAVSSLWGVYMTRWILRLVPLWER
ncbi:MAG: cation-transporting P-type ATPase [Chloroflexi bacterium]|nr:cation-transporting P-type ATPase [Chloroflexota bacterium]